MKTQAPNSIPWSLARLLWRSGALPKMARLVEMIAEQDKVLMKDVEAARTLLATIRRLSKSRRSGEKPIP